MNKNLQSPTTLTEFAPLSPEPEDNPGITYLISKFFKRGGNNQAPEIKTPTVVVSGEGIPSPDISLPSEGRWPDKSEFNKESHSDNSSLSGAGGVELEEGRSLPNVLKRISNLLALKSSGLQSYKDTELKQYWMPDSVSKECYDCGEKFTTFRRKHHCRVCGQIFCSRCCNQEIPGKIMGCTGDLRVCTYCGKVVLSYLQSADMGADLSSDLRALQQDLQTKFGAPDTTLFPSLSSSQASLSAQCIERDDTVKRKTSVGYQEERFIQARQYTSDEQSSPLHNLVNELSHPSSGLTARLGYSVFTASQLVDWLMLQNRASLRSQGVAIGQALLETGYIESIDPETLEFADNAVMFRLREPRSPSHSPPPPSFDELWPNETPNDCTTTDSESECPVSETNLPSSASLFRLDLNLEDSTVHISRPAPSTAPAQHRSKSKTSISIDKDPVDTAGMVVKEMVQSYREGSREAVNWYNTSINSLRTDNAERQAYLALNGGFQQHLTVLLKQLLNSEGLAQSWSETILPLARTVVDTVRPDLRSDNDDMDIRQYVQLKKVSGGSRLDSCIVGGVVCRKNLAHRAMPTRLANPRILLLSCAIVYQRVEGRLMSLEPVMMQEQEYLRHTVARIAAMAPDLVLVQRNVSRLAQESLLRLGISLVLNVKSSVLERVARMTGADIVKSIDAQVCRPQLGKCANFYVKTFTSETGAAKTLMFLEGCSSPHLGCTILLRGAPTNELAKLKRVTGWLIYALYNWRSELSFLMDEFACPPSLNDDNFFHDNSNSSPSDENKQNIPSPLNEKNFVTDNVLPQFSQLKQPQNQSHQLQTSNTKNGNDANKENEVNSDTKTNDLKTKSDLYNLVKLPGKDKSLSEDRKINVESVSDFSDPLHSYLNLDDEVFNESNNGQSLAVSEPLQSNRFRKALDDTLLSVSPFLKFSVPYLETEGGRNCLLRRYFPATVYWTAQLEDKPSAPIRPPTTEASNKDALLKLNGVKLRPVHPFVIAKLTDPVNSDEVQTLLALYRAQGGRLPLTPHSKAPAATLAPTAPLPPPLVDSLDPSKHQRLAVLFCSYSHESPNAPAFCVNPWVVHMDYYGRNDIPLGAFLERYCFRDSYVCPSERCDTSMMKHVRRFVHDGGAVQISLREIEGAPPTDDDSILMWTYCPVCNQQVTQVMRMSNDTWAFSFAKYLELHFHAGQYTPRGGDCTHSLHQACRQFFGHKNMVAYFQYDKISVWEISLPPLLLVTQALTHAIHQDIILEEVKRWALNGYEVFSAILNRLCTLASNGEAGAMVMKQQLQKEQAIFKSRVEEIQLRLTSPTHSSDPGKDPKHPNLWQLEDSLVLLKRSIAEAVCDWNIRLSEAETAYHIRRREEKNKKSVQEKSSASAGLGEIIDGVVTSQIVDVQSSESPRLSRRSLGSQLSQSSLHSADDVLDIDDSHDTLADDAIFMGDFEKGPVDTKDIRPSSLPIITSSGEILTSASKISPLNDVVSESEEVQERKFLDHSTDDDVDSSVGPGSASKESHAKQPLSDRVSVKQILSQLLPKDTPTNPLQCPMSPQEHYTLPVGVSVPVVVYEREPSSIIAYALSCQDYRSGLDDIRAKHISTSEQPSPSPLLKRKSGSLETKESSTDSSSAGDTRKPGVLSFLRSTSSSGNQNQGLSGGGNVAGGGGDPLPEVEEGIKPEAEPVKPRNSKDKPSSHLEVQFSDSTANFIVKIYYADEFARLRATIFPAGEDAFVRSLSRCIQWAARGGKSGSNFAKTKDDRFILKEMSRTETHPFMDSAPQYFDYIDRCVKSGSPTLLGKIVGVYRIMYRSSTSNATFRSNLLVMENLFYGRQVKHKFDLKGSVRNRLVNPMEQGGEIVLLDENLINMTCDSPLYILPHSKTVLMQAIQSDTQFLAGQSVMDYSLLVGLDETNKELVVGIIDYIRTFTWDKRLETMVKKSGLLGGQGKLPTIVSPDEYRDRFIAAMHRYFLPVPDQWTGLGKGLDF